MSKAIEIVDDPTYPEGGHALIRFPGIKWSASKVVLGIESLTEGFDYRGPRRVEAEAVAHENQLNVQVGPDVVGNLKPGIAVNISLQGTDVQADVLWPSLTPPRAAPRRRAMLAAAPRRVVAESATHKPTEPDPGRSPPPKEALKPDVTAADLGEQQPQVASEGGAVSPSAGIARQATPSESDVGPEAAVIKIPPSADGRPRGWKTGGVALVAILAFLLGAGSTGLTWMLAPPSPPNRVTAGTDVLLPSPFNLLGDLPNHAPDGTPVNAGESADFRRRGETAPSEKDASFWRRWAAKRLLSSKTNDAAATLSDFALDLVQARSDKPDLAAARFVWEMAAVANDCTAMDNIVTALKAEASTSQEAEIWQRRATACHHERASNH